MPARSVGQRTHGAMAARAAELMAHWRPLARESRAEPRAIVSGARPARQGHAREPLHLLSHRS